MSELSRRTALMLGLGVIGAGAFAVAEPAAAATPHSGLHLPARSTGRVRAAGPVRSHFTHLVGRDVSAHGLKPLRLLRILDLTPALRAHDEHCFNLIFEATGSREPVEGTYRLSAPGLAPVSLYLSPVGQRPGPFRLQALVNRAV